MLEPGKLTFNFYYFISEADDGVHVRDRNGVHDEEHAEPGMWPLRPVANRNQLSQQVRGRRR